MEANKGSDDTLTHPPRQITVRFHLVRHGETVANSEGLVVGQWDSPLSETGIQQGTLLGKSDLIQSTKFWREYCSDLGRTQETANLVVPDTDEESITHWISDARIREIAKGARQEYPKSWDYDRAVAERQREGKEMPLLETSEDAWRRIADFLSSVLVEAGEEFGSNSDNSDNTPEPITVNVLVVTHAGALRTLLQKMVPDADPTLQHQDDPSRPPDDQKRLAVPNASVTILDVTPTAEFWKLLGKSSSEATATNTNRRRLGPNDAFFPPPGTSSGNAESQNANDEDDSNPLADISTTFGDLWNTRVVEFMWTKHLDKAVTTSNDE